MRLLVTGLGGFLGYAVGNALSKALGLEMGTAFEVTATEVTATEVTATWHERQPKAFSGTLIRLDLVDSEAVLRALAVARPQAIIHMAAISQPNLCETDAVRTAAVNVDATATIARWCARHRCPLVFTSTDLVFDGTAPPYGESDSPNPLNAYARQKVAAERAVLALNPQAVICRMPLMFGYGGPNGKGFAHEMVIAIAQGQPVRLFTDEFRTPLSTACAAAALLMALSWPGGIYHLGGPERISRFELGRRMAAHLDVGEAHLLPFAQEDLPMAAPRPADVSLDNRKAREVGFVPADMDEAIGRMLMAYGLKKE